ncbi:MAG TPA: DUF5985 family protein [Phycisphaerae bacterium]|nr:DUF5985 family protein [Phycisphaerae bacterium]
MQEFTYGALVMASAIISLFFLRYWRRSRDTLFIYFSAAFLALGLNWLALAFADRDEPQTSLYIMRLLAFGLIVIGIWNKNRRSSTS